MLFWIQISKYLTGAASACSLGPSSNLFVNLEWGLIETAWQPDISSSIFISSGDWETVLKRERHGRAALKAEKLPPPECLRHSRSSTKFDFWADKSRFLRQQILAFEGEICADVDAGGGRHLAHLFDHKQMIHGRWHGCPFQRILTRLWDVYLHQN